MQFAIYLVSFSLLLLNHVAKHKTLAHPKVKGIKSHENSRSGKYLFPFAIINFPPEPCGSNNSQQRGLEGVCLSKARCVSSKGEMIGSCQQGLGTCCKFTTQCSSDRRSVTVLETVDNLISSNIQGSCEFVFPKQAGICQVRLDFDTLALQEPQNQGPNAGNCQSESLTVTGAANLNGPLKVCGRLNAQHMILSFGTTSDIISMTIHSEMSSAAYNIRATQIPCGSPNKAPDDCLQYYHSTTAAVKSFGFPRQLNNQRYTICVRPNSGGNTLTWDKCQDMDADGTQFSDRFKVSEHSKPCQTDWIAIDADKYCGQDFEAITSAMGGYARLNVNFDENEVGNDRFNVTTFPKDEVSCEKTMLGHTPPYGAITPGMPTMQLCNFTTSTNECECSFSNNADVRALAFSLNIEGAKPTEPCPKLQGYTADPDKVATATPGRCDYYANIRVTDTANTGFCLRYQAM